LTVADAFDLYFVAILDLEGKHELFDRVFVAAVWGVGDDNFFRLSRLNFNIALIDLKLLRLSNQKLKPCSSVTMIRNLQHLLRKHRRIILQKSKFK